MSAERTPIPGWSGGFRRLSGARRRRRCTAYGRWRARRPPPGTPFWLGCWPCCPPCPPSRSSCTPAASPSPPTPTGSPPPPRCAPAVYRAES
eukprot:2975574-Pyramimonas_sp.AAC.1